MNQVAKKKKTKAKQKAPKRNFCEQVAMKPRHYQTNGLSVRKFTWDGTVAVPETELSASTLFNKKLNKESARPKVEQTVSLNPNGTPDLVRMRNQVKEKGSKPID